MLFLEIIKKMRGVIMRKNASCASTHPCYVGGGYECDCRHFSKTMKEHHEHVFEKHTKEEAINLMSWKAYNKYYKDGRRENEYL